MSIIPLMRRPWDDVDHRRCCLSVPITTRLCGRNHFESIFISKKNLTICMSEPIMKTVTVSGKGQISIPQEIRKQLAVEKGSKLVIVLKDKKLLIRKATDISQSVVNDFEDVVLYSEHSLKGIWDSKEDEVWNRYLKT